MAPIAAAQPPTSTAQPPTASPPGSFLSWSRNKCMLQGGDCIEYFTTSPVYGAIWERTISQLQLLFISK